MSACAWCGNTTGHQLGCLGSVPPKPANERAARDEALERVEAHADDGWKGKAWTVIDQVLRSRAIFTADDIWEAGLEKPHEARALGPLLMSVARRGLAAKTGRYVPSRQVGCHCKPLPEWRSLVFHGVAA